MNAITKPLITTIIPTYRRPKLLRRAIKSVLSQTYPRFQVCVYDNASGDETAEVVAELAKKDTRVKYHCHSENIGALANFNYGMERVNTPFFSFLSDDDILLPEFYESALKGFEKYQEAMFSACATVHLDEEGRILAIPLFNWKKEGVFLPPTGTLAMLEHHHPEWTAIIFRREVVEKIGLIDEVIGPPSDLDLELHVAANYPIVVSQKLGAIFSHHLSSSCAQASLHDLGAGWLKMINKFVENEQIELSVRIKGKDLLTKRFQELACMRGLSALIHSNNKDLIESVEILNEHCKARRQIIFLKTFAWLCSRFPFVRQFIYSLNQVRKANRARRYKKFQDEYPEYSDCILVVERNK